MANLLQLTGGSEQLPSNSTTYDATATGSLLAQTNTGSIAMLASGANTTVAMQPTPDAFYIRPLLQWRLNTYGWLTQYEQEPGQLTAPNGYYATFLAYDRQVPGGQADAAGKIVQLEVPTPRGGGQNPMEQVLPFPSISVGA